MLDREKGTKHMSKESSVSSLHTPMPLIWCAVVPTPGSPRPPLRRRPALPSFSLFFLFARRSQGWICAGNHTVSSGVETQGQERRGSLGFVLFSCLKCLLNCCSQEQELSADASQKRPPLPRTKNQEPTVLHRKHSYLESGSVVEAFLRST